MSRVLFDIVTDICAVGAKKKSLHCTSTGQYCPFFFSLMSRAFINVTPFFTEFVKGIFFCHGRKCAIFVTGKILRHGRFFPRLSWARKKVSRMKEKNTGKNISKNLAFFSGISVQLPLARREFQKPIGRFFKSPEALGDSLKKPEFL